MEKHSLADALAGRSSRTWSRTWYLLAAALLLLSVLVRQPVVFFAAGFVLMVGLLPDLWYRFALRSLVMSHRLSQQKAFFGERITLAISLENRQWLPLPWVEVEEEVPAQIALENGRLIPSYKVNRAALVSAFSLWSFQRVTRRFHFRCMQRGLHVFGPAVVRSSDPLGWLMHKEYFDPPVSLIVYPLVAPLAAFGLPSHFPFGARPTARRFLEDPLRLAGSRAYQQGDDLRRINWKATARTGLLHSHIYESSTQHRLLILLDVRTFLQSWLGIDPEIQELTITIAASIACACLEQGYSVGLATNGLPFASGDEVNAEQRPAAEARRVREAPSYVRVPMARGERQSAAILQALGQLAPYFASAMVPVIEAECRALPYGTTVLLVSPATVMQQATVASLHALRQRGVAVHRFD
ncbi:MAG: DUF58 domain-containing protein [Ktedonobacteraceae bacterium]|nr:DUF58 domain-containing protein [Ktedonobacteraceae bacterium]